MRRNVFIAVVVAAATLMAAVVADAAVTAGNTGWRWGNPLPQGNDLKTLDVVGSRGYAGGAAGTLLRSDDAGASWSTVRTGLLDEVRLVRAIGTDSIVFGSRCALRRSDDGGQTITRVVWTSDEENCSPEIRSFHFPSATVGYLLLSDGKVLSTADGGVTWTARTALPGTPVKGGGDLPGDIWFTADGTGVATAGVTIYRTTDGAASWSPANNVSTGALTRFDFHNANQGVVIGKGKNALSTSDGGATWTPVAVNAGTAGIDLGSVDMANPNVWVVAAANGSQVYTTSDGGTSWNAISPSTSAVPAVGLASATRVIAVGAGGATAVSNDLGATWQTVSGGVTGSFSGLEAVSDSTAYAYGDSGALARTTDGGATWVPVGVSTSERIESVAFPSATIGYVLDAKGVLMKTSNGGASWQFLNTSGVIARAIAASGEQTVVLVGPKGIRRSVDGGNSFSRAKGKRLASVRLADVDRAGAALFAYSSKAIWVSTDAGGAWKAFKRPVKVRSIEQLDMVTARAGYLLDRNGELWVTRNAGKQWKRIETTGSTFTDTIAFGDIAHGYLTDDTGRILYTADAGRTWSRQYPFYSPVGGLFMRIAAPSALTAFMSVNFTPQLFSTGTGGTIGSPSTLTLKTSRRTVKKNATINVSGTLAPASGGERVSVVARPLGARSGANWSVVDVTVASNGTFTTKWKIRRPMIFIARWSGDAARDGDAATAVIVKLKQKRR